MLELTDVTGGMITMMTRGISGSGRYSGTNMFFHAETINFTGICDIQNRVTMIGAYSGVNITTLKARRVEVFASSDDMLTKVTAYAAGTVQGKNLVDAVEILIQFISVMKRSAPQAGIKLADIMLEKGFEEFNAEDTAYILNTIEGILASFPDHEELKAKIVALMMKVDLMKMIDFDTSDETYLKAQITFLEQAYHQTQEKGKLANNIAYLCNRYGCLCGNGHVKGKDIDEATEYVQKALTYNPDYQRAKNNLFHIYEGQLPKFMDSETHVKNEYTQEVIDINKKMLELNPEDKSTRRNLSEMYHQLVEISIGEKKAPAEILPFIKKSYDYNPENKDRPMSAYAYLLNIYEITQQLPKEEKLIFEIKCLEMYLEIAPNNEGAKERLGAAYNNLAMLKKDNETSEKGLLEVQELFEKALSMLPGHQTIKQNYSTLYNKLVYVIRQTEMDEAKHLRIISCRRKSLELVPDNSVEESNLAIALHNLAVFYAEDKVEGKGKNDAISLLEEAVKLNPADEIIVDFLEQIKRG